MFHYCHAIGATMHSSTYLTSFSSSLTPLVPNLFHSLAPSGATASAAQHISPFHSRTKDSTRLLALTCRKSPKACQNPFWQRMGADLPKKVPPPCIHIGGRVAVWHCKIRCHQIVAWLTLQSWSGHPPNIQTHPLFNSPNQANPPPASLLSSTVYSDTSWFISRFSYSPNP